ncbi:SixA phosphatase family protein [Candidatus Erwinia haradaeae]|uniref:SixA phosphatase family protein n=1 Tax=Candidatus Erwinia haradaeae TaxID=1922217 RepID=UPI001E289F77|nr:histidine phosphatase family protein [Candidatus Erwinia haradaeae]
MQIFIMRHGESVSQATNDFVRPLTDRGYSESRQMAKWLKQRQSMNIEKALISPYVRTKQT